jgi:Flp pilus assembly protein protease CpaA
MSASAQHGIELMFPTALLTQCSNTVFKVTVLNTVFAVYEAQSTITQFFAHLTFALIFLLISMTYFKHKS